RRSRPGTRILSKELAAKLVGLAPQVAFDPRETHPTPSDSSPSDPSRARDDPATPLRCAAASRRAGMGGRQAAVGAVRGRRTILLYDERDIECSRLATRSHRYLESIDKARQRDRHGEGALLSPSMTLFLEKQNNRVVGDDLRDERSLGQ